MDPVNLGFLTSGLNLLLLALTGGVFSALLEPEETPPAPSPIVFAALPSHCFINNMIHIPTQKNPRQVNGLHRTLASQQTVIR